MKEEYLAIISLAERLHRRTLDVLQIELARLRINDISAVQAMILLNMGTDEVTAKDLMVRGCYQGTNISYNLKALTEGGYVIQTRSENDRRVVLIKISAKGAKLMRDLNKMFDHFAAELVERSVDERKLRLCRETLDKLDQFTVRHGTAAP